jgi:hypothetical protein
MLDLKVEWEDAPQVRSPVLATTWARLEVWIDGNPVTQFWSKSTNTVRTGVYGSVFPFAQWIVRHWWHVLDEGLSNPEVLGGARRAREQARPWLERHNLVFARDGMAYPDLSIYREDTLVGLRWTQDPEDVTTPGRFLGNGQARLGRAETEAGLSRLVESVLARTADLTATEVVDLRSDWAAVTKSSQTEPDLCARLAELGLDPYGDGVSEDVEEILSGDIDLPEFVIRDLLALSAGDRLSADLGTTRELVARLPPKCRGQGSAVDYVPYDPRPYRAGYCRAESVRRQLGLGPRDSVPDLGTAIEHLLGKMESIWLPAIQNPNVEAAVGRSGLSAIVAADRPPRAQRFLLARALHHWQFVTHGSMGVRLLTRATDWQQSASRAFAAELLAPATALADRLAGASAWEQHDHLADEFQVSPMVIAYQIENHGLS